MTREYTPVRLDPDDRAWVRALAVQETEGNVSQMIRKLVREARAYRGQEVRS
jgi:hypothetical protein